MKLENLYACNSKSTKKAGQVWRKKGEVMKLKNLNPTVKHGGGVFVWGLRLAFCKPFLRS